MKTLGALVGIAAAGFFFEHAAAVIVIVAVAAVGGFLAGATGRQIWKGGQ